MSLTLNIWTQTHEKKNEDPVQTAPKEQSDQDLQCLPSDL